MATLRQYFDTDFKLLAAHSEWPVRSGKEQIQVVARAHYDFNAGVKFVSFYVPAVPNTLQVLAELLKKVPTLFSNLEGAVEVHIGWSGSAEKEQAKDLKFSGRVFIYSEVDLEPSESRNLDEIAASSSMSVRLRGSVMLRARAATERPRAFISHDFRDKEAVGRPLAVALSKLMCPVWYDEFSLKIGDSLRETIEKGLKECGRCVILLSPRYLSNNGWTKVEFNSVFTRELIEEKKLILPVWFEVSKKDIFEYSPSLADRVAAIWTGSADETARKLYPAITGSGGGNWWRTGDTFVPGN